MKLRKHYTKDPFVLEFKKVVLKYFKPKRIISLLHFGTRAFSINLNEHSDYDFFLILDKYNPRDIVKIRKIAKSKFFKYVDLNFNFLYLSDIKARGKPNFQIRSVQSGFYQYLALAKILIGNNIFKEDPHFLKRQEIIHNFDFKIQEFYGRCDKLFVQGLDNKTLYIKLTKYVRDMIRFILIREGAIKIEDYASYDLLKMFEIAKRKKVFNSKTIRSFRSLLEPYENSKNILRVEVVRRGIYERYLESLK